MRHAALVALLLAAPVAAHAQDDAALRPEREQVNKLVQKGIYDGAERSFLKMVAIEEDGRASLTAEDWRLGARIARTLGDMEAVKDRLTRAFELEPDDELRAEINTIATGYGPLVVEIAGGWKGDRELTPAQAPFETDKRAAITFAQGELTEEGAFSGLVPVGKYTLAGTAFEVVPGALDPLRVRVSGAGIVKTDRVANTGGSEAPPLEVLLNVGAGLTAFSAASEGIQPAPFTGVGPRVGLGADLWFLGDIGGRVQLGYHGLFAGGKPEGTDLPSDQLHLVYGWLGGTFRAGALTVAAGPQIGIGSATASGLDGEAWAARCEDSPGDPQCAGRAGATDETLANTAMSGSIIAVGGTAGATWTLAEVGPLRPAVGLEGGALHDGVRLIPWAELALVIRL